MDGWKIGQEKRICDVKRKIYIYKSSANARAGVSGYFLLNKNLQIVAEMWMPKGPKAVFTESILKKRQKKTCNFVCMYVKTKLCG